MQAERGPCIQKESLLVSSSTAEPSTVNRMVGGSNPPWPANSLILDGGILVDAADC